MLRDRLVCGVEHAGITKKLLAEKEGSTYAKAYETALSIEAAEKDTQTFKSHSEATGSREGIHLTNRGGDHKRTRNKQSDKKPAQSSFTPTCYRCGDPHYADKCKLTDVTCRYCKKKGHLEKVCRAKTKSKGKKAHYVDSKVQDDSDSEDDSYNMFALKGASCDPVIKQVYINGVLVDMELDTGASASIICEETYRPIADQGTFEPLQEPTLKLNTYTGESIPLLGSAPATVSYGQREETLMVHVVAGSGPNLFGRDWLSKLNVTVGLINSLEDSYQLENLLEEFSDVFRPGLGCLQGMEVHLNVDENATPKFHMARTVPFAYREKVEAELVRLESLGIISPVQFSNWAAPIVPVAKKDNTVRLCGDYKITVNQASSVDSYPLPRVEELFARLAGGKQFSRLDLSQAYLQLPLDEKSKEYVTINTHKGLYRYNRLPFGVSSAPGIFQRCMENLLRDIKGVAVYLDDILVTGATTEEHLRNLAAVLARLQAAGLRLNKSKCFFLRDRIVYLGHAIDADGLHPTEDKVKAIKEVPKPRNITELRSFLGIINYYDKFLPDLSGRLQPLYKLLCKKSRWVWGQEQDRAFSKAKEALQQDSLLVHFDPSKPLILACDASPYGVGAVLSHTMGDGTERPIAYASRTLTDAEKRYSQIEKEGLAIVFGVKKFHSYLFGRSFTIESDHQPLSFLFGEKKGLPQREFSDGL